MYLILIENTGPAFIATLDYSDMTYQRFPWDGHVRLPDREDLMRDVLKSWKEGQVRPQ